MFNSGDVNLCDYLTYLLTDRHSLLYLRISQYISLSHMPSQAQRTRAPFLATMSPPSLSGLLLCRGQKSLTFPSLQTVAKNRPQPDQAIL